ncbi:MAG: hypothetical protein AB8B80_14710 [Marinicellaceae bacterium]
MSKQKEISLSYKIADIKTVRFTYEEIPVEEVEAVFLNIEQINFTVNMGTNFNLENSTFTLDVKTGLSLKSEPAKLLVEHIARTVYGIKDMDALLTADKESINIPELFLKQLYGISFSHARALLAVELSPTNYKGKYILPVVDPAILLPHND